VASKRRSDAESKNNRKDEMGGGIPDVVAIARDVNNMGTDAEETQHFAVSRFE
jgi:hypothetical protein